MNISITGSRGFLASRFIEIYEKEFSKINKLNSDNSNMNDYSNLLLNTVNTDILIHAAFDHNYKDNIIGIKNILKVCYENKIKKLIHISSISVYDPDCSSSLCENSPYSKLNDPYSKEKVNIENEIEKYKDKNFDIIILQPSIIYGFNGNWTKYALHVSKSQGIYLSDNGDNICNAVYIDDVVRSIYQSCISNVTFEKFLISNNEIISWKDFYKKHSEILNNLNLKSNFNIIINQNNYEFHSNILVNLIFILWFKTPCGSLFNLMIGILKKIRAKKYYVTKSKDDIKVFLNADINNSILSPLGITKKMHNCKFRIDFTKSKNLIGYSPTFNLNDGIKEIENKIKELLS